MVSTMVSRSWIFGLIVLMAGLGSCEDRIELDLRPAEPQLVIVGEVTNRQRNHQVTIHRTVSVSSSVLANPVSGATVRVRDSIGRLYTYTEVEPGRYQSRVFRGLIGMSYRLEVLVGEERYEAVSKMPAVVPIDSVGTSATTIFGQESIYVTLKFNDPPGVSNYYRYLTTVNTDTPRFMGVFSDKFNDGLHVGHDLMEFGSTLEPGDRVKIQRQYVDEPTYHYWRSIASSNPAAAAPVNPPSNISNGALGYFSAYSLNEYELEIPEVIPGASEESGLNPQ